MSGDKKKGTEITHERTAYLLTILILLTACTGCDDGKLKPGEFEDPAFKACVEENLQDYYNNHLIDPADPERYNKVEMLECYGGGVKSLKGIENMPNVDDLAIVDNEIESLEPLRTLTKLTFLKLNNNKIKDLEPLSGLTALATLFLYDNYISDISPLYAVASLKTAGLGGNCILKEQFDELEEKNPDINIGDTPEDFQDLAKCQ